MACLIALLAARPAAAQTHYVTVNDQGGVDDAVGQADMTQLSFDASVIGEYWVKWLWDRVNFSGANTGDACVLFDLDGDLLVDNSMCVQIGGAPAVLQATYPRLFSCNESSNQKCGGSTPMATTATCAVSTVSGPFNGSDSGFSDTQAECRVPLSDIGGTPIFTTVCSYPSSANGGNNDPSDCIVNPGTRFSDLGITISNGTTGIVYGTTSTYTVTITNYGPFNAPATTFAIPAVTGLTKTSISCAATNASCPAGYTLAQVEAGVVNIPVLNLGGSVTLTVNNMVTATSGNITATATVTAPTGFIEPDLSNNSASDTDAVAGIIVTPTSGLTTTEAGGTTTFTIRLISAPSAAVTIPLSSSNTAEGTVGPTSVTFTALNWSTPQTITVTGVDDVLMDGNIPYSIIVGVATSTDVVYGGLNPSDVSVTNLDNDLLADLVMAKSDGAAIATSGATTTYSIVATNNGPAAANGALVTDPAVAGLSKTTVSCSATGGAACPVSLAVATLESPGLVIPTLPAGGSITLTVPVSVSATGGTVANTATVTAPAGVTDPTPGNNAGTDTNTVVVSPDLAVTLTDGVTSVNAGGSTTYSLVVTNSGPSTATGAALSMSAPGFMTFGNWTCSASGGAVCPANGSGNISVSVDIPPGGQLTFTVPATVAGGASGLLATPATIAAPGGATDPNLANNAVTDTDSVNVPLTADVSITKTDGTASVNAGSNTTYTIVVTNNGPNAADGTIVTDAAASGLSKTVVNCSASGGAACPLSLAIGTLETSGLTIPTLPASGSVTLTVTAAVTASSGAVVNSATLSMPAGVTDPTLGNNAASDSNTVGLVSDLSVTKSNSGTSVNANGTTTYVIVVSNAGPSATVNATISDPAVAGLTKDAVVCAAAGGASCPAATVPALEAGTLAIPSLPAGSAVTFTVTATVTAATGTIVNVVTATSPAGSTDPNPGNNSATDSDTVVPVTATADLSVVITDGVTHIGAGSATTYTITVTNAGPSAVTGATLTSVAPTSVTYGAWTCAGTNGGSCSVSGSGTLNELISLPVGASVTFTVAAAVAPSASGAITAAASVSSPAGVGDPNPANNGASDSTTVTAAAMSADLSITKSNGGATLSPGASTVYTIVVANAGPGQVAGATVRDSGSSWLTLGAWSCAATGPALCPAASGTGAIDATVDLPASSALTFTLNATVNATASGSVVNTATIVPPVGVTDPNGANNSATDEDAVPTQRIGIAKEAGDAQYVAPFTFEVPYAIRVQNLGLVTATNVQVSDSLAAAFAAGSPRITLAAAPTATVLNGGPVSQCALNPAFDGVSSANLLAGDTSFAAGQGCAITFRVRLAYADAASLPRTAQSNQATAATYASPGAGLIAQDVSDSGRDPATSNSGAPGDTGGSSDATPVTFVVPRVDITKAILRVTQVDDTTFDLRYMLRVKNTAAVPARNVQVSDDLATAFAPGAPAIGIVDGPSLGEGDASLTLAGGAAQYNGTTRTALLTGDDGLAPGQERAIAFTVRLRYASPAAVPVDQPLRNTAFVTTAAAAGGPPLTSVASTDATNRLAAPSLSDEPSATVVTLTPMARLSILKLAGTPIVEIGESVAYAIRVTNNGGAFLPAVTVEDRLPLGFSYVAGTARLTVTNRTAVRLGDPSQTGATLTFGLPAQDVGEATLTYRLRVGAGAQQGDGINRAAARRTGDTSGAANASATSSARVIVRGGVFTDSACVVGRVFVDANGNRRVDDGTELGIPGVRVIFEDGTVVTTDAAGNYSLCGLRAVTHVLKIDPMSLPRGAQLVVASNRQAFDTDTMFVDLKFGELRRADFVVDGTALNTGSRAFADEIARRRQQSERGLLPPDWSGGINGSLANQRGAGVALPPAAPLPVTARPGAAPAAAASGTPVLTARPATFDNVTGGLPDTPAPWTASPSGPTVGRIDLEVDGGVPASPDRTARVRVTLVDADGRPVQGTTSVRIELAGGTLADARVPEAGVVADVVDGVGTIDVQPLDGVHEVALRATSGLASASGTLSFATPAQPIVTVGLVEGLIGLTRVNGEAIAPARPGDVFDTELKEFSRTLGDDGVAAARGAMYLRGTVKGDYLMTMAYDSEKQTRGVLFRDIQPDAFYPIYGDASVKTFDAQTSGRFYLRVERGRSYLLYGDLLTAGPAGEARSLGTYSRTLTGLQQRIERGRAVVNLFASRDTLRQVIDEVAGRGISGPYSVSHANGVSGTEKVEVITRDRNQPAIVLGAVAMTRFVDYEFEPFTGRVLFRRPVPSMDERLNPVSVRITYEVDGGGERHWVEGADGQLGLGRLSLGGAFAQDHNPFAPFTLASANAVVSLNHSTTFLVEGAQTTSTLNTSVQNRYAAANLATVSGAVDGRALRAELRHTSARAQARVYFGDADPAFNNPSASFYGGRSEAGARAAWQLTPRVQLKGEAIRSKDRLTGGSRSGGLLAIESRFRRVTVEAGLRTISETATPAQPSTLGVGQSLDSTANSGFGFGFGATAGAVDPATGLPIVSGGVTPLLSSAASIGSLPARDLDATTVRAKLSTSLGKRWSAYGEAEQDVTDADKHMAAAGGDYRFTERGRLYGRHEFISSLDGIYGLSDTARTQRTVVGVASGYMKGGDVFSEYRMHDAMSGREAQAAIGLRNAWSVADGVRLSTGLERVNPLRGTTASGATAASLGLEHTRNAATKATGRIEWRHEGSGDQWLSTVGLARKLSGDWTLLAKDYFQLVQPSGAADRRQNRLWFGTAYRDRQTNRLNLLSRYELRLEQQPTTGFDVAGTDRRVQVLSTHADYRPLAAWTFFGQYAGKWVREKFEAEPVRYHAHLWAARATYDVTSRVDVGSLASVLWDSSQVGTRKAFGAELGVLLRADTWLSVGYNLTGFSDRDLRDVLNDGYTTRGAYVRLKVKFDESLFTARRRARGARAPGR